MQRMIFRSTKDLVWTKSLVRIFYKYFSFMPNLSHFLQYHLYCTYSSNTNSETWIFTNFWINHQNVYMYSWVGSSLFWPEFANPVWLVKKLWTFRIRKLDLGNWIHFLNVFFSGRIQTLNPYSRDDISSATFSKVCIIWKNF